MMRVWQGGQPEARGETEVDKLDTKKRLDVRITKIYRRNIKKGT
jgi:hypothetical protein